VDLFVQMLPNQVAVAREAGIDVRSYDYPSIFFIAWNSRVPELSDPRVRRALTLGMNRAQLIEGVQLGDAVLLNGSLPPIHWAFDPALGDSLAFDPDQARRLLDEAGWADRDGDGVREDDDGNPLQIDLIYNQNLERERVAEIIRVQLQDIGVELLPSMLDLTTYGERIQGGDRNFEGALVTFETGFRIDDRDLFHSDVRDVEGSWAFSGTQDSILDRYLDTLQLIPDRNDAYPLWQEYQLRLMELQPYTFLYSAKRRIGVGPRLRNVVTDTRGDWATIRRWWIEPGERKAN
jgi:peptide/nickel transport system substrate-binding protein